MADVIPVKATEAIMTICLESASCDALEIAEQLMGDCNVRMHGPEHHFLVAASILTAYCNRYNMEAKYKFLKMAKSRTVRIPVAMCALYGTCGAMMGAGAAVSTILSANPFAPDPLVLVNRVTADIQNELASYTGIRCCKRATWASVRGAINGLNGMGGIELPVTEARCPYAGSHKACIGDRCNY